MAKRRKVLVLGPEAARVADLVEALGRAGFAVAQATALPEGARADLAIVDVSEGELWPAAEALAEGRLILLVDGVAAMRRGFGLGAEDCVLAQAHADEVVARCEAIARRSEAPAGPIDPRADSAVYVDRRLWVNFATRQVWVKGKPAQLTPREFRLLEHLIQHRDMTLSHEKILEAVWGRPGETGRPTEVLKQYIWRLRQKIEGDPNQPDLIVTDPGAGYRFVSRLD